MQLVYVTAEQAAASQRAQQFAKAIERQNRALREGFAVVDARGSVTRIDQRVTGDLWEEIQKKLGGIDTAGLQNVNDARAEMRAASRAAWKETKRAEREKASIDAPAGKTAGNIRMAWMLSRADDPTRSAEQLEEALSARGLMLACVSATEAYASERRHAFAAAIGNRATAFKEGEIVAVNEFGTPYRLNARATGVLQPEIDARLAVIDRAGLLDITGATAAMREASHAAWLTEKERTRPPSVIEARITECAEQARHAGAVITCNAEGERVSGADALADRLKPDGERVLTSKTVFGKEAFAARLDEAGIALARVTAADIAELAALRRDESLAQLAAHSNNEARRAHRYAEKITEGDIVAVTRGGDVHWISVEKLSIYARLFAVGTLPSVADARQAFETDSQRRAELWAGKREEAAAAAELRDDWRDFETPADAIEKDIRRTGRAAAMAAKVFETGFNLMFGWAMAGPKLTPQQQRDDAKARTNEETLHAEAYAGIVQAKDVEHDDRMHAQKTAQQEKDLRLAATLGIPPTAEAALNRDEFERQREADRER